MHRFGDWAIVLKPARAEPRIQLVCFPHVGGNAELFWPWVPNLDDRIELIGVRMPGRGPRLIHPLYTDWSNLVEDVFNAMRPGLSGEQAFFGHCFGGRLAYEIARRSAVVSRSDVRHVFVSACRGPNAPHLFPYVDETSDDQLRQTLRLLGGMPSEVIDNDALMELMMPAIRSEMRLSETWVDRYGTPTDLPITGIHGRDDPLEGVHSMRDWESMTIGPWEGLEVDGGHFYLHSHGEFLVSIINSRLVA